MKYFHCVIPSNADHPEGKFATETYIAADSKAEAKVKASRWLPLPFCFVFQKTKIALCSLVC